MKNRNKLQEYIFCQGFQLRKTKSPIFVFYILEQIIRNGKI